MALQLRANTIAVWALETDFGAVCGARHQALRKRLMLGVHRIEQVTGYKASSTFQDLYLHCLSLKLEAIFRAVISSITSKPDIIRHKQSTCADRSGPGS
jgi:hypothetical protein